MKKNKKLYIIGAVLIITAVGLAALYFLSDRQKFTSMRIDINNVKFDTSADTESIKSDNYCNRNNMKYSKGSLACHVGDTITYATNTKEIKKVTAQNTRKLISIGWQSNGSNLQLLKDSGYIMGELYTKGEFDCYQRYKPADGGRLVLEVGCSGPAKAEWFPVKTN